MKKTLLIICLSAISISSVYSQKIGWGLKATYQKSNYSEAKYSGASYSMEASGDQTISLSFFIEKTLCNSLYFQPNITFTQKNLTFFNAFAQRFLEQGLDGVSSPSYTLGYIEFPLLLRYNAFNYFNFYAGPSLGIVVQKKGRIFTDYYDIASGYYLGQNQVKMDSDFKEYINNINIGVHIGAGFEYKKFEVGLFYEKSFISPFKNSDNSYSSTPKFGAPYITLGYRFK